MISPFFGNDGGSHGFFMRFPGGPRATKADFPEPAGQGIAAIPSAKPRKVKKRAQEERKKVRIKKHPPGLGGHGMGRKTGRDFLTQLYNLHKMPTLPLGIEGGLGCRVHRPGLLARALYFNTMPSHPPTRNQKIAQRDFKNVTNVISKVWPT